MAVTARTHKLGTDALTIPKAWETRETWQARTGLSIGRNQWRELTRVAADYLNSLR